MPEKIETIYRFEAFDSGGAPIHVVAEIRSGNCLVWVDSHSGASIGGCEKCMKVVVYLKGRNQS